VSAWFLFRLPSGSTACVPATTAPAAISVLRRNQYNGAPVETYPIVGALSGMTRGEVASVFLGNAERAALVQSTSDRTTRTHSELLASLKDDDT
jgi:hypothetical protein